MGWWPFKKKTANTRGEGPSLEPPVFVDRRSFFNSQAESRLTHSWRTSGAEFNEDIRSNLVKLRERSRDHEINNTYAKRWIKLYKTHVVGEHGIRVVSVAESKSGKVFDKKNSSVEDHFNNQWARKGSCDVTGRMSWIDVQEQVVGALKRDGEVFVRLVTDLKANDYGLALQVIRADLCDEQLNFKPREGNEIRLGIELNQWERPVAYYFKTTDLKNTTRVGNANFLRIPAGEILHIYYAQRPEQLRGFPDLHTALEQLWALNAYQRSEMTSARLGACRQGFFVKSDSDAEPFVGDEEYPGDRDGEGNIQKDEFGNVVMDFTPGMNQKLPAGWSYQAAEPSTPNNSYDPFVRNTLMSVASSMNLSYSQLANDYGNANYSSLRASIQTEQDIYKGEQRFLIDHLVRPVFKKWLWHAVANNKIPVSALEAPKFENPSFQPRRWQWIDPAKEAAANEKAVENNFKSLTEVAAERGRSIEDILIERKKEMELLKTYGLYKGGDEGDDGKDPAEEATEKKPEEKAERTCLVH